MARSHHPTRAWLYSVELARPKRVPMLAQAEALDRAMRYNTVQLLAFSTWLHG
jgi:hypothetical protein